MTTQTQAAARLPIENPGEAYQRRKTTRTNYELYGWVFMRASGVLLLVLMIGFTPRHLINVFSEGAV